MVSVWHWQSNLPADDEKILVFSEWTDVLDLLQIRLEAEGIGHVRLDGKVNKPEERAKVIERFEQEPNTPVFLVHTAMLTG